MSSYVSPNLRRIVADQAEGDQWADHFRLDGLSIIGMTEVGEATARLLGFNHTDRLLERQILVQVGRYPSRAARERMKIG